MKVILIDEIRGLGSRGDVVTVKDGYARNFLLPKQLAREATPGQSEVSRAGAQEVGTARRSGKSPGARRKQPTA